MVNSLSSSALLKPAKNQTFPLRLAYTANCPILLCGKTMVSSQVTGTLWIICLQGLFNILCGSAPRHINGDVNTTIVATWCAQVTSPNRLPKCTGVKSAGPAKYRVKGNVVFPGAHGARF